MKAIILLIFLSLFTFSSLQAQAPPNHVPLMTNLWKMIAEKDYKQNKNYKWVVNFPTQLRDLNNKEVELPGYIIPIKADFEHKTFMLAVVPYDQCAFCGQGNIPSMVEVHMLKALAHSDKPVKIRGKLVLNQTGDDRSEVFLLNARVVK